MAKSKLNGLKQAAENCMKQGNFTEAFFHWTSLIKIEPDVPKYYYERSKCFSLQEQFYLALQDAEILIKMQPSSILGHSRKAEILYDTKNFEEALPIILKCFGLAERPEKDHYMEWSRRCKRELVRQKSLDTQYPFVGAAVGIVLSTLVVVWDHLTFGRDSFLFSPVLKVSLIITVSGTCFAIAKSYRNYLTSIKSTMLKPPIDLYELGKDQDLHND